MNAEITLARAHILPLHQLSYMVWDVFEFFESPIFFLAKITLKSCKITKTMYMIMWHIVGDDKLTIIIIFLYPSTDLYLSLFVKVTVFQTSVY